MPANNNNNNNNQEQQAALALQSMSNLDAAVNNKDASNTPPDVLINLNSQTMNALQKLSNSNGQHDTGNAATANAELLSSSHSRASSSPSVYIKDEPDSQDESFYDNSANKNKTKNPKSASIKQRPRLSSVTASLVIDEDADILDDFDEDINIDDCDGLSTASTLLALTEKQLGNARKTYQPTAKEILYNKFSEFLAARLNTLSEEAAQGLINKILLLLISEK